MRALVLAIGGVVVLGAPGAGQAQELNRAASQIDWPAAQADFQQSVGPADAVRSALPSGRMAAVSLPVLLIGTGPERSIVKFTHQQTSYVASYLVGRGAKLAIMGSASPLVAGPQADIPLTGDYEFVQTEEGADLSFSRYGADYLLQLTCENPDTDPRCTERDFLVGKAQALVVTGGDQLQ